MPKISLFILLLALVACSGPTLTATPPPTATASPAPTVTLTPTATLTLTPEPTATAITKTPAPHPAQVFAEPMIASIAGRKPDYHDEFSNVKSGWESNIFRDPCCSGFTYYQEGVYVVVASPLQPGQPDGWNWAWGNNQTIIPGISNYVFEIEQHWVSGRGLVSLFLCDGTECFNLWLPDSGGMDLALESLAGTNRLELGQCMDRNLSWPPDQILKIRVVKMGQELAVFANDQPACYGNIPAKYHYRLNLIQLRVGNLGTTAPAEVHWDNLKVWVLKP